MENKKSGELSRKFWYVLLGVCLVLIVFVGIIFFLFANREEEVIEKKVKGGNIVLNYTNNITGLNLTQITPTEDSVGMKNDKEGQYFDFSVDIDVDEANSIEYEIAVIKNERISTLSDDDMKIYLEKEESGTYNKVFGPSVYKSLKKDTKLGSPEGSMVLVKEKTTKSLKDNYRLRLWLSSSSVVQTGNYSVEVVINGKAN
ncbi:MAG: hypothetical protein IKE63_04840 [Bacilli bacterium]|nr:hypothetical protein [Bacilli bacterium]